jgi:hypothetical protein
MDFPAAAVEKRITSSVRRRVDGMGWDGIHSSSTQTIVLFLMRKSSAITDFFFFFTPPAFARAGQCKESVPDPPPPTHTQRPAGRQCNGAFAFIPSSLLVAFFKKNYCIAPDMGIL